jgi:chromatin remodeling complex protein RSC6
MPKAKATKTTTKNTTSSSGPTDAVEVKSVDNTVITDDKSVASTTSSKQPEEKDVIGQQFDGVLTTLSTFRQSITALQTQIRGLEKAVRKEMKGLRKEASKNRAKGNRKPSGFAKPSLVTAELCKFMGKDEGTEIARTEVTQYLIQYIKDNELQFAENKKIIVPDATLKALLDVKDGDEVTYFNLQRLMNKHFVKKDKKLVSSTV